MQIWHWLQTRPAHNLHNLWLHMNLGLIYCRRLTRLQQLDGQPHDMSALGANMLCCYKLSSIALLFVIQFQMTTGLIRVLVRFCKNSRVLCILLTISLLPRERWFLTIGVFTLCLLHVTSFFCYHFFCFVVWLLFSFFVLLPGDCGPWLDVTCVGHLKQKPTLVIYCFFL